MNFTSLGSCASVPIEIWQPVCAARRSSSTSRSWAVRVRIDLERLVELHGACDDARPIRTQAGAKVPDPSARMRVHVHRWIRQRREIALRLILLAAELPVERAEHEVAPRKKRLVHVAAALRREVHLDAAKDP